MHFDLELVLLNEAPIALFMGTLGLNYTVSPVMCIRESATSNSPKTAPPFRIDRHLEFRQRAPLTMHKVVDALSAALIVGTVRMVEESADDQLALEIAPINMAQLSEYIGKFLVGFRNWLHVGFQSARQHDGDDIELICCDAPHLCSPFTSRVRGCAAQQATVMVRDSRILFSPIGFCRKVLNAAVMEPGALIVGHEFPQRAEMDICVAAPHPPALVPWGQMDQARRYVPGLR